MDKVHLRFLHNISFLFTDDVFVPRDIDLDNGDLDEMEREVEAFKR